MFSETKKNVFFLKQIRFEFLRCLVVSKGPGRFREVREAGRNHFHLSWYLSVSAVTSYVFFFDFPDNIGSWGLLIEFRVLVGIGR